MKVLLTGASGQLAAEIMATCPKNCELLAYSAAELDITSSLAVRRLCREQEFNVIINAAAYTAVDQAEQDHATAFAVNQHAVAHLVQLADEMSARLIHISTDFVFDGAKRRPYCTQDAKRPLSIYGQSKSAGEDELLSRSGQHVVVRTSWLYSAQGHNFVNTILQKATTSNPLRVVCDQFGAPTWTGTLAPVIWKITANNAISGIIHISDDGETNWCEFANEIISQAHDLGMITTKPMIAPIRSYELQQPAMRPSYSVLNTREHASVLDFEVNSWQQSLHQMLSEKKNG